MQNTETQDKMSVDWIKAAERVQLAAYQEYFNRFDKKVKRNSYDLVHTKRNKKTQLFKGVESV